MNVFSVVPHPISVPFEIDEVQKRTKYVTIRAGRNEIDDPIWNGIKDRLEPRLQKGHLRASQDLSADLNDREMSDILGEPSKGFIRELCAKSQPIDTGEIEPGSGDYKLV